MASALVLAYNFTGPVGAALEGVCVRCGLELRFVSAANFATPVGALAGIPIRRDAAPLSGATFSEPMLVMCHFLRPQLDGFLQAMRDAEMPPIPLKAVLTPTNATWTARALRDELAREHEAMRRQAARRS